MRILIISPRFPPTNAADMQRVRMLLPYFRQYGAEVEVLAVNPDQVACTRDEWLVPGLPQDVPIHRVEALSLKWTRIPGLGDLNFRAMRTMGKKGDALLRSKRFDLVFFSTTAFELQCLGPRWKRKFGVPFVLDYQDPWVNDYYQQHKDVVPPGGRLKHGIMDWIQRYLEPRVLKECAATVSVSAAYPEQLAKYYPWMQGRPALVQPFPGAPADLKRVEAENTQQNHFSPQDGRIHWVYAGTVAPGMQPVLRAFLAMLKNHLTDELLRKLCVHFIGTTYATGTRANAVVGPIAKDYGVEHLINERPERVPYSEILATLRDADALLVLGSAEPGYTASKIYPYLLSNKPLLTIFHAESSIPRLLQQVGGGTCTTFPTDFQEQTLAKQIAEDWIVTNRYRQPVSLNAEAFSPYTAEHQAKELTAFFAKVLAQ